MRAPRVVVLLAGLLVAGCLGPSPAQTTPTPAGTPGAPAGGGPAPAADGSLVEANAGFGLRLADALAEGYRDANLFLSPLGISMALAMAYEGASGEARAEMARVLGFDGLPSGSLSEAHRALLANLSERDGVALEVANAFWMRDDFAPRVRAAYVDLLRTHYASEVVTADFADPATVDRLNQWASDHTRGKVPRVLDSIDPSEVALLLDAVYFQGNWTKPFRPDCTRDAPFARADGSTATVRMMCGANEVFESGRTADARVVRLPYADGRVAAYVALPEGGKTVDDLLAWSAADLGRALDGLDASVGVEMPRFNLTAKYDLVPTLRALGMAAAFEGSAFNGIAPGIHISRATHDAILQVDEIGTVAAAVTVIAFKESLVVPPETVVVDRPFLFVIRDDVTGSILFLGKVVDPSAG